MTRSAAARTTLLSTFALACLTAACSGNGSDELNSNLDTRRDAAIDGGGAGGSDASEPTSDGAALDAHPGDMDAGEPRDGGALDANEGDDASSDANGSDANDGATTADTGPDCDAAVVGARIELQRDPSGVNPERVTSLRWLDSASMLTQNLAAEAAGSCVASSELFGHAMGFPEGTLPLAVGGYTHSAIESCGPDVTLRTVGNGCNQMPQLPVTTSYHSYGGPRGDQLRITRTFGFSASSPAYNSSLLLPYVTRLRLPLFPSLIYPNQAGTAVTTLAVSGCPAGCTVDTGSTWSGTWFAYISPGTGLAVIVQRDPTQPAAVRLVPNWDAFSNSNLTSIGLIPPEGGWKEELSYTQYLCIADLTSWPQAQRDAAILPASCLLPGGDQP